jgi:predicted dinucleotide-utilizing enzyme
LIKGAAGLAKVKLRGRAWIDTAFTLALAAYNLIRLPRLLAVPV